MSVTRTRGGTKLPKLDRESMRDPLLPDIIRFMDKIQFPKDLSECWVWSGKRDELGYGHFKIWGLTINAHRVAWMFKHRRHPGKWLVRHTCDNKSCVNPDHLLRGTFRQNERDKPFRWKNQHGMGGK